MAIITPKEYRSMEKPSRLSQLKLFASNWLKNSNFELIPINTDASSRKYYRIILNNKQTFIILDDEKCCCKTPEFVELSKFLNSHNIYVPKVFAQDIENGILLIEDLGSQSMRDMLNSFPKKETDLYISAADAVAKIAAITEQPKCTKELSPKIIMNDIQLFTDWYFPMATGAPLNKKAKQDFMSAFEHLLPMAFKVPNRLVLWDYHIDNIMFPPNSQNCAIIDFQDAMWGPLTYDIMSLLAADRKMVSPSTIDAAKDAFFNQLEGISRPDFEDSYAFMSMFRHLRVLGRFTTLSMVNQKEKYLQYIPQLWTMLDNILQYPKLLPIKQWLDNNFPKDLRGNPQRKPINSAILLAAGRGIRMQNLTDNMPKPLIKVGDKSLIDYNFERLKQANIENIVINLCYKGDMIREHIEQKYPSSTQYSIEEQALETGGGIKKALPLLKSPAFFACNSDVFFIDHAYKPVLWKMMDEWNENKYDILLLLQDTKHICGDKSGDYKINDQNKPERNSLKKETGFPYMFAGISIVSKKIFKDIPQEKFSLRDLFDKAQSQGRLGFIINDADFFHVGTPQALSAAQIKIKGNN